MVTWLIAAVLATLVMAIAKPFMRGCFAMAIWLSCRTVLRASNAVQASIFYTALLAWADAGNYEEVMTHVLRVTKAASTGTLPDTRDLVRSYIQGLEESTRPNWEAFFKKLANRRTFLDIRTVESRVVAGETDP